MGGVGGDPVGWRQQGVMSVVRLTPIAAWFPALAPACCRACRRRCPAPLVACCPACSRCTPPTSTPPALTCTPWVSAGRLPTLRMTARTWHVLCTHCCPPLAAPKQPSFSAAVAAARRRGPLHRVLCGQVRCGVHPAAGLAPPLAARGGLWRGAGGAADGGASSAPAPTQRRWRGAQGGGQGAAAAGGSVRGFVVIGMGVRAIKERLPCWMCYGTGKGTSWFLRSYLFAHPILAVD